MKVAVPWALFQKASISIAEMTFRIKPCFASLVLLRLRCIHYSIKTKDKVEVAFLSHLIIIKSYSYKGSAEWQV